MRADEKGLVSGGWGLRLRAVDMARFGMLALQNGRWEGKQVVPIAWVKEMTTGQSTPFFGYYWWVKNILEGGVGRELASAGHPLATPSHLRAAGISSLWLCGFKRNKKVRRQMAPSGPRPPGGFTL